MPQINPQAFTLSNPGILRALVTQCEVCQAYNPAKLTGQIPPRMTFNGLWDTGASATMITSHVAQALGLTPTGMCNSFHAQGASKVNTYIIKMHQIYSRF